MNINEFLIKRFRLSQEQSIVFLQEHEVFINGRRAIQRMKLNKEDSLTIDGDLVREAQTFCYYAYYKPRGIECTLNLQIEDNLKAQLTFNEEVYPVGRLDKDSEGLLLLTNDGRLYKEIALAGKFKEKEYEVKVDKVLTEDALHQLSSGLLIKGKKTRPAYVEQIGQQCFRIILTQGINRQIRRMCYKLGYEVMELKRVRIAKIELGDLMPGCYRKVQRENIL